jgi:1,4-alpha-glucan branching enzyme
MPTIVAMDPWLAPHTDAIRERFQRFQAALRHLNRTGGILGEISTGYRYFGFTRGTSQGQTGLWYREWAPGAQSLRLIGVFNRWNRDSHPLARDPYGTWHIFLPDVLYGDSIAHGNPVKVHVVGADGSRRDRLPAYARRVVADAATNDYTALIWLPDFAGVDYPFLNPSPHLPAREGLRIYEVHIGMAQEEGIVGTFDAFRERILPRIAVSGYNAIQIMAVQEHPYYASFGYHVSSFYAVSSRFGTPEDLKHLVDAAHGLGILVFLDLVHSHSVKNVHEGLNKFDGTDHQYFHAGDRGLHPAWDSMVFDYAKYEVQRFLLSNVRWWLEEFRFDGFRFDGVTSMLYLHHGLNYDFTAYSDYFPPHTDEEAVLYLQLANRVAHAVRANVVTIAEDVSGLAGIARPIQEGGIGFDYRLAMGVPDYWIKLIKERRDEDWNTGELFQTLVNRRWTEAHIGYAESHDQALVGDQTLAFRLMGDAMYWNMAKNTENLTIDRGIALHKIIRLLTFALAGEGYLAFMGNEFGHPDWIDFPRDGNLNSFAYARRQWSLVDNENLRYGDLQNFDRAMLRLDPVYHLLRDPLVESLFVDEPNKILVFRRGPLVFAVNFHPSLSVTDYRIPVPDATDYGVVLDTDATVFSGHGRVDATVRYVYQMQPFAGRNQSLLIYLPSRTGLVFAPVPAGEQVP